MTIAEQYPSIKPSLSLDFASTKRLDPRITFSRASEARYYDGKTVAKAEENLFTRSQEIDQSPWVATQLTVTANTSVAPDGTTTAETLTASAGTGFIPRTGQNATLTSGASYVFSAFCKAGTYSNIQFYISAGGSFYATFDLSTGTVGASDGGSTVSITSVGNGWYRCSMAYVSSASGESGQTLFIAGSSTATRSQAWNPVGTETVLVWGAQLEQRSSVTAYTPTTTQPITNYIPVLQTAQANVARFQHNPTTFESEGFFVEEQRTNLVLRSDDFATTWGATRAFVTANTLVAPNGTLTGDKLSESTALANSHYVNQNVSLTSGTAYTFSVYAKAGERTKIRLRVDGTAMFANAIFDLSAGSVVSGTGVITAAGNGWYRCSVSGTSDLTGSNNAIIYLTDATNNISYNGDGYSGAYLWGAQLEQGNFSTSYIPTAASQVTRSADSASMTGTNFFSWYRADEGTLYVDNDSIRGRSGFYNTSNVNQNFISIVNNGTTAETGFMNRSGVNEASIFASVSGSRRVSALSYKTNEIAFACNGVAGTTDTVALLPLVDYLQIGSRGNAGDNHVNGTIRKIAYYPIRCTNAQLQALTQG